MSHAHRILVIEDDPDLRELIEELFELKGYGVTTAENGRQGLAQAQAAPPDLIICDVMMPEMDGHATVQAIRALPHLRPIPFVFLTARSTPQDFREGMNLGADDFLTKPFDNYELLRVVETRLARHAAIQAEPAQQAERLRRRLDAQEARLRAVSQLNSHELRAPLTRMIGLIRLLLEGAIQPDDLPLPDLLQVLEQSTQEMDTIIHQINTLTAGS